MTRRERQIHGAIVALLLALGLPQGLTGLWALLAPHDFYVNVWVGGHPIAGLGGYDEHLVRDVGALLTALGLLMGIAAVARRRELTLTAAAVWLTFAAPHLAYHLLNLGASSTGQAIANVVLLVWMVLGAVAVVALVWLAELSRQLAELSRELLVG